MKLFRKQLKKFFEDVETRISKLVIPKNLFSLILQNFEKLEEIWI